MSTEMFLSYLRSPVRDRKGRHPSILLARMLMATLLMLLPVAARAADWQTLGAAEAAGHEFITQHVRPGMTYVLDLADENQYNYVKHQLQLAGESPEKSPELYRRIEEAHQEKRIRQPKLPMLAPAFATANSGNLVPLNIIEAFLPPRRSDPNYTLVTLSSYPGGTDYTHLSANLTYQKKGGGKGLVAKNTAYSKQAADGTNFRLTAKGTLPSDAANLNVTATALFLINKDKALHAETHLKVLGTAHATDGCLSQPMYPGQTGCLNKVNQTNPLVMCYWRQPGQGQDCAYRSPAARPPVYQFPIAGTAIFDGPLDSVDSVFLTLQRTLGGGGCVLCGMSSNDPVQCPSGGGSILPSDVTVSGSQISWDWTGNKIAGFPSKGDCIQTGGDMTWMNLLISVVKQDFSYATVQFSSQLPVPEDGRYPLPEIDILDGCLARGTRIRLEDGSEREVDGFSGGGTENVRSGRRPAGSGRRVLGNTRGVESIPMVRIEDGDGRSLLLTEQHPVVTQDGVRAARDLKVGDVVLTETGPRELILVGRQRYDDEVFNLKLDGNEGEVAAGETTMYANGFLVGDARMQRSLARQALERRSRRSTAEILKELPAAWHQDFLNHQQGLPD